MPFRSKAQVEKMRRLEAQGEVPRGTVARWLAETPGGVGNLPRKLKPSELARNKGKSKGGR